MISFHLWFLIQIACDPVRLGMGSPGQDMEQLPGVAASMRVLGKKLESLTRKLKMIFNVKVNMDMIWNIKPMHIQSQDHLQSLHA